MGYNIEFYLDDLADTWDCFVLEKSMNGTFLQTRRFLSYHPQDRFVDKSVVIRKGNEIVAVVPGCEVQEENIKAFWAHKGSTYGGIIINKQIYNSTALVNLLDELEVFLKNDGFQKICLKLTPELYSKEKTDLLDYFLYFKNFNCYNELNFSMNLKSYKEDTLSQFSSSKRRDYHYATKQNLNFRELLTREQVKDFYGVLQKNLQKLGLQSVHTYEELVDLKYNRFAKDILFYGVYKEDKMIAGSMVFLIGAQVFHTQYLSSDEEYLKLFPMDFLIFNLIEEAKKKNREIFSFGICTEDRGHYINLGLARFKEGFGAEYSINRTYEKMLY